MFKTGGFGDEIYQSMEKQLVSNQLEDKHGFNKLSKAADYLNSAAEIFEQVGMRKEASEITEVLHSLAADQLASRAFSVSDLLGKIDILGVNEEDLHNILESSTPAQLFNIAKKVSSVMKGKSSLSEEVLKSFKEADLSDPKVREKFVSKIMSALKIAKLFV
jgi:hypothetical protein